MAQPSFVLANRRSSDHASSRTKSAQNNNSGYAAVSTPRSPQVAEVSRMLPVDPHNNLVEPAAMDQEKKMDAKSRPETVVPENFGIVASGLYRSDWPKEQNFAFIETLGLKTILTLVQKDELDPAFAGFMRKNYINHRIINMAGTKKQAIPLETMAAIMDVVLDKSHYPLLIHCNHGKHRTGCVVGVYRHLTGWSSPDIVTEYNLYAGEKARECDQAYLANFNVSPLSSHSAFAAAAAAAAAGVWDYSQPAMRRSSRRPSLVTEFVFVSIAMILIWTTTFYRLSPSMTYSNASNNDTSLR